MIIVSYEKNMTPFGHDASVEIKVQIQAVYKRCNTCNI